MIECSITKNYLTEKARMTEKCTIDCSKCLLNTPEETVCLDDKLESIDKAIEIVQDWSDSHKAYTNIAAAFEALGYEAKRAFAAMADGFVRRFTDRYGALDSEPPAEQDAAEQDATEPALKTDVQDSRRCWCDTCQKYVEADSPNNG